MIDYSSLPPELQRKISHLDQQEKNELFWELEQDSFEQRPVTIDEFIDSPYFLGEHLADPKNPGKTIIFPFWRDKLRTLYPSPFYNAYNEVLMLLPIGAGKTVTTDVSCLYEIYKLLCLKDPQAYYGLSSGTIISFVVLSVLKSVSKNVNWSSLEHAMEASPWFQEHCPIIDVDAGKKTPVDKDNCVNLPKNIQIQLGSNDKHALGRAVFWAVLDEAEFTTTSEKAYKSYTAITRRRESRFKQFDGDIPGVIWVSSSPKYASDFLSQRMEKVKDVKTVLQIKDTPIWEVRKHMLNLSGEWFKVFIGDDTADPKILSSADSLENYNNARVIDVPEMYRDSFTTDLVTAIKDIAGRSGASEMSLFPNVSKLLECATVKQRFSRDIIKISTDGSDKFADFIDPQFFRHLPHAKCNRYLHVDIGLKNDRFALASVYSFPLSSSEEDSFADFLGFVAGTRMYVCEFVMVAKNSEPGKEIPLRKVIEFLNYLKQCKYPAKLLTFDIVGRGMFDQEAKSVGYETKYFSVDREKEPYITLKNMVLSSSVIFPGFPLLIKELRELKDMGKKIDHPMNTGYDEQGDPFFSKDAADAMCGAVFQAVVDNDKDSEGFFSIDDVGGIDSSYYSPNPMNMQGIKEVLRNSSFGGVAGFLC